MELGLGKPITDKHVAYFVAGPGAVFVKSADKTPHFASSSIGLDYLYLSERFAYRLGTSYEMLAGDINNQNKNALFTGPGFKAAFLVKISELPTPFNSFYLVERNFGMKTFFHIGIQVRKQILNLREIESTGNTPTSFDPLNLYLPELTFQLNTTQE